MWLAAPCSALNAALQVSVKHAMEYDQACRLPTARRLTAAAAAPSYSHRRVTAMPPADVAGP